MSPSLGYAHLSFLMCGSIAAAGAPHLSPDQATPMLVGGLTAQGLGFLISLFMNANYHRRMIQWGFPSPKTRPSMFIAVGPPAFTALSVLGMADAFPESYINYFGTGPFNSVEGQRNHEPGHAGPGVCTAVFVWSCRLVHVHRSVGMCSLGMNRRSDWVGSRSFSRSPGLSLRR
ncbi:malic acid transport protein [Verticillium alfalfae VaMs.102]|uniref:Malic acid transport protein n=1 Tax=Verticillium alfalfae (strain VaMs.102 / ATCC MYA-4576 / FGSC 10136) TaxID=526221 RepID=C9SYW3_VERA1|nr:malic acid transport protein [Verticillium alfalfae VaMs.102]EEY23978.1 malic acid transport protein [Verticillium alfalfae VaMs.102]